MKNLQNKMEINALLNLDIEHYENFSWKGYQFLARISDVYDGDTFTATWLWKGHVIKQRCRCIGYNSPEIRPKLDTIDRETVIESAHVAKNRLNELLCQNNLILVECFENDNFGRMLTVMYNVTNGEKSLNQIMLDENHGTVYVGSKSDPKLSDASLNKTLLNNCPV